MESKEVIKKFKEQICPFCINYNKEDYQECKIVMQIEGEADCINYKCNEYCRKRRENESKSNKSI